MRTTIIALAALAALAALSSNASAGEEEYRPRMGPIVEAENGQRYQLEDITPYGNGGAAILLYTYGAPGDVVTFTGMLFDCRGHLRVPYDQGIGPSSYIPPRSVAARIAQIACAEVKGR